MCTCERPPFVTPAPGTVDVPTNAELFIADTGGPSRVTIVGGGESVVLDLQQLGALRNAYQGELSLAPGTTYEILRGPDNAVLTTFTTGSGPDDAPPPAVPLDELFLGQADLTYDSSCGDERFQIDIGLGALPAEVATLQLAMPSRLGPVDAILFPEELTMLGGPSGAICSIHLAIDGGTEACVELRARDHAGNTGPPSALCTTVRACTPVEGRVDLRDCELASSGCSVGADAQLPGALLLAVLAWRLRRRASG